MSAAARPSARPSAHRAAVRVNLDVGQAPLLDDGYTSPPPHYLPAAPHCEGCDLPLEEGLGCLA